MVRSDIYTGIQARRGPAHFACRETATLHDDRAVAVLGLLRGDALQTDNLISSGKVKTEA